MKKSVLTGLYSLIVLCLILNASNLFAQKSMSQDRSKYYKYGDGFNAEIAVSPVSNTDSIDVMIFYRTIFDLLQFSKTESLPAKYTAEFTIEVAVKDKESIIRKRAYSNDTVTVDKFELTDSKDLSKNGYIYFRLAKDTFGINIVLADKNNPQTAVRNLSVSKPVLMSGAELFAPIFAQNTLDKSKFKPVMSDKTLPFSSENVSIFIPALNAANMSMTFSIDKAVKNIDDMHSEFKRISGTAERMENSAIKVAEYSDNSKYYDISKVENGSYSLFKLDFLKNNMLPGDYSLVIRNQSAKDSIVYNFSVVWEQMPLSLRDPDYAAESMYYILNDNEYDEMTSGSKSEKIMKIWNWWKTKDPSSQTPFNEAMEQYFKRVDYAFFNYQTIMEKDGSKTQRGMVYILYGKPDEVKSEIKSSNSLEIWIYNELKKEFTFEMISEGVYKLMNIKE